MEIFLIGFWVVCGIGAGLIAQSKGRSSCVWFIAGFLLGPIALMIVGFMGSTDRNVVSVEQESSRIKRLKAMEDTERLADIIEDQEYEPLRLEAAAALAALGDKRGEKYLRAALRTDNDEMREMAQEMLANLKTPRPERRRLSSGLAQSASESDIVIDGVNLQDIANSTSIIVCKKCGATIPIDVEKCPVCGFKFHSEGGTTVEKQ